MSVLTFEELIQNHANTIYAEIVVPTSNSEVSITTTVKALEETKSYIRRIRDLSIQNQMWKYDRHARELRLGLTPTDSPEYMLLLDAYIKALSDIPEQSGFPYEVTWPTLP